MAASSTSLTEMSPAGRTRPRLRTRLGSVGAALALAASLVTVAVVAPPPFAAPAGAVGPDLTKVSAKLTTVASGFTQPTAIAYRAGDPRMYIAEQPGRVKSVYQGVTTTVLTITVSLSGERGLLGLAFSPDGTKMYVDYTDLAGNTNVDEYTMSGTTVLTASRRRVLFQTQPFQNHNGGQLAFGPDGMLYIAFGDGGGAGDTLGNAQNLGTQLGKILRIDPRKLYLYPYRVPTTNPFFTTVGAKKEIWMYGLRNPWKFSFDRATGDMWIGDVGQGSYEEVDFAAAGEKGINWGWNKREGNHYFRGARPAGNRDPVIELKHTDGACAVIGGYVYRGTAVANLAGAYVFSDFCLGRVVAAVQTGGVITARRDLGLTVANPTAFGQAPDGEVYVASHSGIIYRIAQA